jgi:hypothetical protein
LYVTGCQPLLLLLLLLRLELQLTRQLRQIYSGGLLLLLLCGS